MQINYLQYQQLAEPLSTSSETIYPDKWLPTYPDRIWKAPRAVCMGQSFEPVLTSWTERAQIDKWQPNYPDRISRARRIHTNEFFFPPQQTSWQEAITLDKWTGSYPDRINRRPSPTHGGQIFGPVFTPAAAETITPDKWLPSVDPMTPGLIPYTITMPQMFVSFETGITIDKWLPTYPDRIHRRRAAPLDTSVKAPLTTGELITLDKWSPVYPVQFILPKRRQLHESVFLVQVVTVTASSLCYFSCPDDLGVYISL